MQSDVEQSDDIVGEVDGLICAFLLDGEGGGSPLDWTGVRAWKPEDGLLWVHLDRKDPGTSTWIENHSGIPSAIKRPLLSEDARPRVLVEQDRLLVILRGVNLNPDADPEDMVAVRCWIEPDRIVTLRHVRLMAVNDIREMIARGDGPADQGEFLVRLTDRLIDRMGPVISEIDDTLDEIEETVQEDASQGLRARLVRTRRSAIGLRRYLAPQRDAMSRLQAEKLTWLTDLNRAFLREIADRTTRYVEDLEAARERAAAVQDEFNYQMSERMNRTMYVLTVVAAILLPPSLLTGLLGINVGGLPGVESPAAFWIVAAAILVLGVFEYVLLRKLKWI
ncbi:MAG: zinc transporter ZntB [Alphaproteobacteria bacterium]